MELKPVLPQPFSDNMRVVREGELINCDPELPADAWQLPSKMAIPVPDCVLALDAWALRLRPEPAANQPERQLGFIVVTENVVTGDIRYELLISIAVPIEYQA